MASFKKGETGGSLEETKKITDPTDEKSHQDTASADDPKSGAEGHESDQGASGSAEPESEMRAFSPIGQMEPDDSEAEIAEDSDATWDLMQDLQARDEKSLPQPVKEQADDVVIDNVVDKTNEIYGHSVQKGAMEIAELVLADILKGDQKEALNNDHFKNKLYARFSQHPKLNVDPRRISEWVRAVALKKELTAEGVGSENLGLHHLIALLKVKDPTIRAGLALETNDHQYSVRKTREEVDKVNGRESTDDLMKTILRQLQDPRSLLRDSKLREKLEDANNLKNSLDSDQRLSILGAVEKGKKDMAKVQAVLTKIGNTIFQVEQDERSTSVN